MNIDTIKAGTTNFSATIRIIDSSDGSPETAVEHDTTGIDLWYRREGSAKTGITAVALAALTTAHTDRGIEHIGDGYYRLDLPDAAVALGASYVEIGGTVTGMVVIGGRVTLTAPVIVPKTLISLDTTSGDDANIRTWCEDENGAKVALSDFTTTTANVTVTPLLSGADLFSQALVAGDIRNNGFEKQKATPNFVDDTQYRVYTTVTLDGTTYETEQALSVFG